MKHKWWHGIFTVWLGHREYTEMINKPGATPYITFSETSIFCPICMKKIVIDNLKDSK